ncbi:DUF4307 domain-containing protein [Pseudolysinimonas yzui]|uniref:DUF4307 domain-containing protein n=1 Tax=Pseudolysinimonas yzui TaxID=2708254 RepID=A0A8J3M0U5_9MICO|nr:DUF4307 domain-containing protein [Pseudolysinimonas yzui]GHF18529.1 hypothetical protein GCM10011600_19340 [Pseudolysinimonas yzui]
MTDSAVAARYGRTPADRRRRAIVAIVAAAGVLVVVVAWVVWVGVFSPTASIDTRDTGYVTRADSTVDIRFEVTTEPGTPVSCALQALNESFAIVGWKIVELPPGDDRTRAFVENVRVTEPAVTGLIYRCWLT